ncbi:TraF-like protein [Thioflavicoccus mobilis 8321]|uniref:TraF-like protein n=1 Tax=Thioflavicoccus mobilis 8321 TaxID=765912 RepID=L0GWP4_9GAMM|nr:conjugal transfer protein TraF [Thioflavicoccus mobilis]AGA89724.1 TraF-like protein [Thioflavicoccus mobilis 8321]
MRALLPALVCLSLALPPPLPAAGFYFREQEGWFWYQREPEPAELPEPETPEQPVAPAEPQVSETTPQGPHPLSAQWLRERLGGYRDAAIDDPTPENVALYLYLQRVALDKSSRFAAATQRAVQLDPFLDVITQRPTATFAANLTNRQAGERREAILQQIAEKAGIWFFYRSDCPYCEAQAPLLQLLEARYGFSVLPVSIDGELLPGGVFPAFRRDLGQAAALGVVSTPALFLARPPDAMVPLSQGLLSLAQLQERVLVAAVQAGWISEGEFTLTRPVTADLMLDVDQLPGSLPEDPEALLSALRALARASAVPVQD